MDLKELEEVAKPLVKYLRENGNPHQKIIIDYLKPDDKYMTYEDKKKNIDFVGIEFAYEGEDKTEMIWLEKNLLEKIKQKKGIDLPEIIEKIIEK